MIDYDFFMIFFFSCEIDLKRLDELEKHGKNQC